MSLVPYVHLDVTLQGVSAGTNVPVAADDLHHLTRVLRLRQGAAVVVADGGGSEAPARLADQGVIVEAAARVTPPRRPSIGVAQALVKGRKLDEVVRQVAELGTERVVPVAAERSVVDLRGDRAARATERWRAVARASAEQSRSPWRTRVEEITTARALAVGGGAASHPMLVAHPGGSPLPEVLAGLDGLDAAHRSDGPGGPDGPDVAGPEILLAIGPEGGWSDAEVARWLAAGARTVGLGPTVLRTEHAAAAAVAVTAAWLGRWG